MTEKITPADPGETIHAGHWLSTARRRLATGSRPPVRASVSTYAFSGTTLLLVGAYLSIGRGRFDHLSFAMSRVSYRRYSESCPNR